MCLQRTEFRLADWQQEPLLTIVVTFLLLQRDQGNPPKRALIRGLLPARDHRGGEHGPRRASRALELHLRAYI